MRPRCLWLLGIVPKGWLPEVNSQAMLEQETWEGEVGEDNFGYWVCTDGSAQNSPQGTRAGYGVHWQTGTCWGAVNGLEQTAQRAEVRAVWAALCQVKGRFRLCSDSRYVVDTLGKTEVEALKAGVPHLDLWERRW